MPAENVVIYTASGCPVCYAEVEFLSQNNVPFSEAINHIYSECCY